MPEFSVPLHTHRPGHSFYCVTPMVTILDESKRNTDYESCVNRARRPPKLG